MADWLFSWKGFTLAGVILLAALGVAIVFRDGPYGNIASIFGVAVGVLGFVITIWTVHDARQQIKDASTRAEKAIAQAAEESRRAIERIAALLFASDCAALQHGVENLRQAAQDEMWPRAVYRCQECRIVAARLAHDSHLTADEASQFRQAVDDFALILVFIERNRLDGQTGVLQRSQIERLDELIGLLVRIQGRTHHESLRPI